MPFSVDVQWVRAAEEKLGCRFPSSYVVRLCRNNGGAVDVGDDRFDLYPVYDQSDRKRLKRTCNDVVRETMQAADWPDWPDAAVAIGSNGTGDRLVLLRMEEDPEHLQHAVYWWDHETGDCQLVADDFGDLADA